MAGGDVSVSGKLSHLFGQAEETDGVRDGRTGTADAGRGLLLCKTIPGDEQLQAFRLFDGVQVFTLQVFDEGDLHRLLIGHFPDDDGNRGEAHHAGRSPPAFTGNQLIGAIVHGPDQHGLEDAVGFDGLRQLLQSLLVEGLTGLFFVGFDLGQTQFRYRTGGLPCNVALREQCV